MKILLLEDDILLNEAIAQYLSSIGHRIQAVRDGNVCLEILQTTHFDLLVLDINVPNVNGLRIVEELHRLKKMVPVIFISTLIDIEDISKAFELGCFDYLKKPFHLKELGLRIDKIFQTQQTQHKHKRLCTSYSFDMESMTLFFNHEPQTLSKRQMQIIHLLCLNLGFVCTYEMFMDSVWDDIEVDVATIRAEVNRLKTALKEDFIFNVRGVGYVIKIPH